MYKRQRGKDGEEAAGDEEQACWNVEPDPLRVPLTFTAVVVGAALDAGAAVEPEGAAVVVVLEELELEHAPAIMAARTAGMIRRNGRAARNMRSVLLLVQVPARCRPRTQRKGETNL